MITQPYLCDLFIEPALGEHYITPGEPIRFDDVYKHMIGNVVLVDRSTESLPDYVSVKIQKNIFFDHDNPMNKDRNKGSWRRRIVYNDGKSEGYYSEYGWKDEDK